MVKVNADCLTQITKLLGMDLDQLGLFVIKTFEHSVKTGSNPLHKDRCWLQASELPELLERLTKVPYLRNELISPNPLYSYVS